MKLHSRSLLEQIIKSFIWEVHIWMQQMSGWKILNFKTLNQVIFISKA